VDGSAEGRSSQRGERGNKMDRKKDRDRHGDPGIGRMFQDQTKYTPEKLGGHALDWENMPKPCKEYAAPLARVSLPEPEFAAKGDLWTLLNLRRSRREYTAMSISYLGQTPGGKLAGFRRNTIH
jgi:hypothetical protein